MHSLDWPEKYMSCFFVVFYKNPGYGSGDKIRELPALCSLGHMNAGTNSTMCTVYCQFVPDLHVPGRKTSDAQLTISSYAHVISPLAEKELRVRPSYNRRASLNHFVDQSATFLVNTLFCLWSDKFYLMFKLQLVVQIFHHQNLFSKVRAHLLGSPWFGWPQRCCVFLVTSPEPTEVLTVFYWIYTR